MKTTENLVHHHYLVHYFLNVRKINILKKNLTITFKKSDTSMYWFQKEI